MSLGTSPLGQYPLGTDGILTSGSGISVSVAVTDGADVLAAQIDPQVAVTSATTDGADVLSASVDPIVSVSSATTDGADVLAASITVGSAVSVSAAWTDGADTLASTVDPVVAASSATTDGADILAGAVGPIVALSSATTDGQDVLAAQVQPLVTINFSAAWTDGADTLVANLSTGSSPFQLGGSDGDERKTRHKREKEKRRKAIEESFNDVFEPAKKQSEEIREVIAKLTQVSENATYYDHDEEDLEILLLTA